MKTRRFVSFMIAAGVGFVYMELFDTSLVIGAVIAMVAHILLFFPPVALRFAAVLSFPLVMAILFTLLHIFTAVIAFTHGVWQGFLTLILPVAGELFWFVQQCITLGAKGNAYCISISLFLLLWIFDQYLYLLITLPLANDMRQQGSDG